MTNQESTIHVKVYENTLLIKNFTILTGISIKFFKEIMKCGTVPFMHSSELWNMQFALKELYHLNKNFYQIFQEIMKCGSVQFMNSSELWDIQFA